MENRLDKPQRHDTATEGLDWSKPLVTIRCITYNQEPYIRDALEGFVMQETTFPFEAIVHDDASTDGTAAIIREYAEKYPHIIKPIFQTENQYSKGKDSRMGADINAASSPVSKYIALCEGDDYWIVSHKLQRQADWMENHSDYSMCWTDALLWSGGEIIKPYRNIDKDFDSNIEETILNEGGWIPTASLFIRRDIWEDRPIDPKFYVGDYVIQIWCAHMGKCRYFAEQTCVYRQQTIGSWTSKFFAQSAKERYKSLEKEYYLLKKMDEYTRYEHTAIFELAWHRYAHPICLNAGKIMESYKHYRKLPKAEQIRRKNPFRIFIVQKIYNILSFFNKKRQNISN